MANFNPDVEWDYRALATYMAGVEEYLLEDLTRDVEDVARQIAPVRVRHTFLRPSRKRGSVGLPGRLKASVQSDIGHDFIGPYGDVAALWYGRFLDPKAVQLHRLYPFLPSALYYAVDGKNYYL